MDVIPVILSGGAGTRLWPLSRELYPKQLLAVCGGRTLLQEAALRLEGLDAPGMKVGAPLVVTAEESRFLVKEQLTAIGRGSFTAILEPAARNTAPALTLAALEIESRGGGIMFVLPADHFILNTAAFMEAAGRGLALAAAGKTVTFAVPIKSADTAYGYLRKGGAVEGAAYASYVTAFVEKPEAAQASEYAASGNYCWNSGMFVLTAAQWIEEMGNCRPDILGACRGAFKSARRNAEFRHIAEEGFVACPAESVDRAVIEKMAGGPLVMVPLDAGWADAGSWPTLWEILQKDAAGNAVQGDVFASGTSDSLLMADGRLLAVLGMRDVVVVETADAVLVAERTSAREVRRVVDWLKDQRRSEHVSHQRVFRPWGYYQGIDAGDRYQVKRIMVKPGQSLSLQLHRHRAEHWVVVKGKAKVTCGERVFELVENQSTYIPVGIKHRLENPGGEPLEMIEVQSGGYLGEDDIVRFEDRYDR